MAVDVAPESEYEQRHTADHAEGDSRKRDASRNGEAVNYVRKRGVNGPEGAPFIDGSTKSDALLEHSRTDDTAVATEGV